LTQDIADVGIFFEAIHQITSADYMPVAFVGLMQPV
jgi:hypothetical protein